jgi:hypothetical protein
MAFQLPLLLTSGYNCLHIMLQGMFFCVELLFVNPTPKRCAI